jgi:RNA polymerase sigma-70 factor (ECF subfamily)
LWAVALRTLSDREDAADALQEALLSAFRSADRFRGESAVTTWLHRIVVNSCLDRARRRQARPTVALPEVETVRGLVAPDPDSDTALAVHAALAQLPAEQRVPLVLLDMQGYSVTEIAQLLGVAEGTVKSRCARGRARLAVMLGHLRGPDPHTPGNPASAPDVGSSGPRRREPGGVA